MSNQETKLFLGIGKTLFNSSATLICQTSDQIEIELLLSERLQRAKACGSWPEKALKKLQGRWNLKSAQMAENRDVAHPVEIEEFYNSKFPFYEHLKSQELELFSQNFNKDLTWVSHHLSHANAAHLMSPYEKSIIVVMDGAGSNLKDFPAGHPERVLHSPKDKKDDLRYLEECSVYLQDGLKLTCVSKRWQTFFQFPKLPNHWFSQGLGSLYEKAAEFIFNDKRAAGKVMGLAAFGRDFPIQDPITFLEDLDWSKAFKGKGKAAWEQSGNFSLYSDVAASVQKHFENSVLTMVQELQKQYPEYNNLILAGGCALNCTTNMKIHDLGIFSSIYVPPFPGDESIGLGTASFLYFQNKISRTPWAWEKQNGYFGSIDSLPLAEKVKTVFKDFEITEPESIETFAAQKIADGHIIGWYQGRSETGPRALGNRSILARVDKPGVKDQLNAKVKMRENFRPYGSSVIFEKAHRYFEIPEGFENPFMSFAVNTRTAFTEKLREVTHYDGTSRMQTVRSTQNPRFYKLLSEIEKRTDIPMVLNTSLNVMGEPIVESIEDAKNFLLKTDVSGLAIGDFYISKPKV